MQTRIIGLALTAALALATPAGAQEFEKMPRGPKKLWAATLSKTVTPGKVLRWRSPRIGTVHHIKIRINGGPVNYDLEPGTKSDCVGYVSAKNVVARITDCRNGRRVRYVRVQAFNFGHKPARLLIRLSTRFRQEPAPPAPEWWEIPGPSPVEEPVVEEPVLDAWGRPEGDPCYAIDPTIPIPGNECTGWQPQAG